MLREALDARPAVALPTLSRPAPVPPLPVLHRVEALTVRLVANVAPVAISAILLYLSWSP